MQFRGALIERQGIAFGIVLVQPFVLTNPQERDEMQRFGEQMFGSVPIVLAAQNQDGFQTFGRPDIVGFLESIHPSQIPWQLYTATGF